MDLLYITLYMDTRNEAPDGPGWYIHSTSGEKAFFNPVPITQEGALEVASAFQRALQTTDKEIPVIDIPQAVRTYGTQIRKALEDSLKYAEEQAAKIPLLRQRLSLAPPPKT